MTDELELVARLRKQAVCVYIATEESVARDISDCQLKAAAVIESLMTENKRLRAAHTTGDSNDR